MLNFNVFLLLRCCGLSFPRVWQNSEKSSCNWIIQREDPVELNFQSWVPVKPRSYVLYRPRLLRSSTFGKLLASSLSCPDDVRKSTRLPWKNRLIVILAPSWAINCVSVTSARYTYSLHCMLVMQHFLRRCRAKKKKKRRAINGPGNAVARGRSCDQNSWKVLYLVSGLTWQRSLRKWKCCSLCVVSLIR